MASTFPTSLQSFTTHIDNDPSDLINAEDLNPVQDTVKALEDKVGIDDSTVATSQDYLIKKTALDWIDATDETWTYASASTFTITGDKTGKYGVGDKIKLTQTTVKYFYITALSYGAPNTTVTVNGGSDYTLANAAITVNYFSKVANPQGFPHWFAWTASPTGITNITTNEFYFCQKEKIVFCRIHCTGTSNASAHAFTLPITVANTATNHEYLSIRAYQGGAWQNNPGLLRLTDNSTTAEVYLSGNGTEFSSSGIISYVCYFFYQIS